MQTQAMYLAHGFAHCMSINSVVTAVGVLTASLLAAQTYKLVLWPVSLKWLFQRLQNTALKHLERAVPWL